MSKSPKRSISVNKQGVVSKFNDWIFGYDFFISYSHKDGMTLPQELETRLEEAGFNVFLDQSEYAPGMDLRRETRRQVRKSKHIVVLLRPNALHSSWVFKEVESAIAHNRIPILVDVNNTLRSDTQSSDLKKIILENDWLRLNADMQSLDEELPSSAFRELLKSFKFTRQNVRRQRFLGGVAFTFLITTLLACTFAYEAIRQRNFANQNFQIAQDAAEGLVVDITQQLRNVEGISPSTTEKILSQAEKVYDKLLSDNREDERLLAGQVEMYTEFVETYLAVGNVTGAQESAVNAVELARRLSVENGHSQAAKKLALANIKLGDVLEESGEYDESMNAYVRAFEIRTNILSSNPNDTLSERDVASAIIRIGQSNEAVLNYHAAAETYEEALVLRRKIAKAEPKWRRDLVINLILLANAKSELNSEKEAYEFIREAVSLSAELSKESTDDTRYKRDHAVALQYQGNIFLSSSDYEQSLDSYSKSKEVFEDLSRRYPDNMEWRRDISVSLGKLASVRSEQGKVELARPLWESTIRVRETLASENIDSVIYTIDLIEALWELGKIIPSSEREAPLRRALALLDALENSGSLSEGHSEWKTEILALID